MIKRQSVLLLLLLGVMALSHFVIYQRDKQLSRSFFAKDTLYFEREMVEYLNVAQILGSQAKWDMLRTRLEDARANFKIGFYILRYKGKPAWWGSAYGDPREMGLKYDPHGPPVINEKVSYQTVRVGPGVELTVGIDKDFDHYFNRFEERRQGDLLIDVVLSGIVALIVAFFAFRDVLQIVRKIRTGKLSEVAGIQARSAESELMVRSFSGYNEKFAGFSHTFEKFANQVLPSLKNELLSGVEPPYSFDCTLVRTDINGFSQLFNSQDVTVLMAYIDEFFTEVTHVVSRYNGLIHEFVGDEVIFYFKDESHENSFAVALSALHEINIAADRLRTKTTQESGYPFTVKSSLAHGTLRFGPLVNGFSLAGSVLIETVRVLSHVTEKEGNVVYFTARHLPLINGICVACESGSVKLKGFDEEQVLYRYESHVPLDLVLQNLNDQSITSLSYFRSDQDVARVFNFFTANAISVADSLLLQAIFVYRKIQLTKTNGEPGRALCAWLDAVLAHGNEANHEITWRVLASGVLLLRNLVPSSEFSLDMQTQFKRLLHCSNKRVVANAVEALTLFTVDQNLIEDLDLLGSDDNRVQANTLVYEGTRELGSLVIKRIKRMLASKDAGQMASALYALGEIAFFHRERDLVFYKAQMGLHTLVNLLPKLVLHRDVMVRRQAMIAAQKSQDDKVIASIWKLAHAAGADQLYKEALKFLNEKSEPSEKRSAA